MKKALIWTLSGAATIGLIGTGIASWALLQPAPDPDATPGEPVDGIVVDQTEVPALYTGDELEWFIPADEVITSLVGADTFADVEALYTSPGEREGFTARLPECDPLVWEDFTRVIGQRFRGFSVPGAEGGGVRVLQFASAEAASTWVAPRLDVPDVCATFDWGTYYEGVDETYSHYSYQQLADVSGEGARVVVDRLDVAESGDYDLDSYQAIMLNGNTVTMLTVSFRDDIDVDAEAVASALLAQSEFAHEQLTLGLR